MKCDEIRAQLAMLRPDSRDADHAEFASALLHLQQCDDCQVYWQMQQQSDRKLGRAVRNVAIPADFKLRLLNQLSAALETPLARVATLEPVTAETATLAAAAQPIPRTRPADRAWTRRRAATVTSAAVMLLAFGSWFFLNAPRQVQLSTPELLALSSAPETLPAFMFQESFRPELPDSEIQLPNGLRPDRALSVQHQGQEIGAFFSYPISLVRNRGQRPEVQPVVLIVVDLNRVVVSDLTTVGTSFRTAAVTYPPPKMYATRVWRVGQTLYLCYVRSTDAEQLERLKVQDVVS